MVNHGFPGTCCHPRNSASGAGRVLAVDRQVAVEVDLTEEVAGKSALQDAAADIAERLLPKIVQPKGK
jgi:hypothetical protein